jgi:hypothetical protein
MEVWDDLVLCRGLIWKGAKTVLWLDGYCGGLEGVALCNMRHIYMQM